MSKYNKTNILNTVLFFLVVSFLLTSVQAQSLDEAFGDLASTNQVVNEETTIEEDGEFWETGAVVSVKGVVRQQGSYLYLVDEKTDEMLRLDGFQVEEGTNVTLAGVLDIAPANEQFSLVLQGPASSTFAFSQYSQMNTETVETTASASVIAYDFPKEVKAEAKTFTDSWAKYVKAAKTSRNESIAKKYKSGYDYRRYGYASISAVVKAAWTENKDLYSSAIADCDAYLAKCEESNVWASVDNKNTWLYIDKNDMLIRVLDKTTSKTLVAVPFACGANPDLGQKQRNGDLRTPNVPTGLETLESTPFFVGNRAGCTVAAGMTVRCMGVNSKRPEDAYWVKHGMNICIHGTPYWWSMGQPASHGCCRVMEKHIPHVYALTAVKTAIVIRGINETVVTD